MNDYTVCFDESEYNGSERLTKNIKGYYNKANYEANKQFTEVEKIKAAIAQGIQLWDVPCIRETYTEDNDTEESSESEEEEEQKDSSAELIKLHQMMKYRKAKMKDLRKGFVFFMDQEKTDMKRHAAVQRALKLQQKTVEVDGPKEWWEDGQMFRTITEWTLQKNEWLDVDQIPENSPPYTQIVIDHLQPSSEKKAQNSEETDEEFDWFEADKHTDDTYFTYVNKTRKTIEAGD